MERSPGDTARGELPRPTYSAPALEKGLDILELLATSDVAMTIGQIAERLDRSKSEIFRMVFVLEQRRYLLREPASDLLRLSNRLFDMGLRSPRPRSLIEVAFPAMEALSAAIGHASHLVVINRGETVVIASATSDADVGLTLQLGYRRRATEATSGQTILAFQSAEGRQRLVGGGSEQEEAKRARAQEMLYRRIVKTGYLIARSHDIDGITDIAAPILDRHDHAVAALVVPCLRRRGKSVSHHDLALAIKGTCDLVAAQLSTVQS